MTDDGGPADEVVHPRWQMWVAENLARGAESDEVRSAIADEGLAPVEAAELVRSIGESPALGVARRMCRRVDALETMLRLRREHRRASPLEIQRITVPTVDRFLSSYWVPGVPVILTDLVTRWPAFGQWSLDDFVERFSGARLEASVGRSRVSEPDAEWEMLRRDLSVEEFGRRVLDPHAGNDTYVIAKNAILRRKEFAALLDDLALDPGFFGPRPDPMRMSLWIGPAGTHTPLHHDGDNAVFCQVVGRKRFRLAPPESLPLLDRSRGVYSTWDPPAGELPDDAPEQLLELELRPGDALFIPAGWWHQVDALDLSMSVSILHFAWPNDFSWYKPGSLLRGTVEFE